MMPQHHLPADIERTSMKIIAEPEMEKNGTFASPATAFASSVLPVPGGASHPSFLAMSQEI